MKWKEKFTEIKEGDYVDFISPDSENAKWFNGDLKKLKVRKVNKNDNGYYYSLWTKNKNYFWGVYEYEVRKSR